MEQNFVFMADEKDIKGLRNYISSWFGLCPTLRGNKCDKYMNYLEKVGIDITEPYRMNISEAPTPKDQSQWTEALYFRKVEYLRLNFAYKERVPELKEISKVVFAEQIAEEEKRAARESGNFQKAPQKQRSKKKANIPNSLVLTVLATVAIIGVITLLINLLKK